MGGIDWHSAPLTSKTVIDSSYRNTQNVRRYFKATCGPDFKFDRDFMAWMKAATDKTLGEAAAEWLSRRAKLASPR
jgi:hypothetical protein